MRIRTVALLVALAAAGCARSGAVAPDEFTVIPDGPVTLISGDDVTPLEETTTIEAGSSILTGDGGRAQIDLGVGGSLELAPGAEVALPGPGESEVRGGSVLVRAPGSGLMVRAGATDLEARSSVFRIDQGFSLIVAVYRGAVDVLGSGVEPVPALRQATVVGGEIQSGHRPLQVRRNDVWDATLLGPAIDLGLRLLRLERGLARQLPSNGGPQAVADALGRSLPRSLITQALTAFDAARATVAVALAQQAARLAQMPSAQALGLIADLYADGAHLIVVVAQLQLAQATGELVQQLARLTSLISRAVAPEPSPSIDPDAPARPASSSGAPATSSGTTGSSGGEGGSGGNGGGGGPAPDDEPPTDGNGEPDPGEGGGEQPCANQVDCFVGDLIGGGGDEDEDGGGNDDGSGLG